MKSLSLSVLAAGAIMLAAIPALAAPITGNITMGGSFTPTLNGVDSTNLATATGFDFAPPGPGGLMLVESANGDLAPFALHLGTIKDFTFNPFSPVTGLYTVVAGTETLSFDLSTITVDTQNSTFLSLNGTGELNLTGSSQTAGVINLTATDSGGTENVLFSFTAGTSADTVPEPASAAILGLGLLALAGFTGLSRRRHTGGIA